MDNPPVAGAQVRLVSVYLGLAGPNGQLDHQNLPLRSLDVSTLAPTFDCHVLWRRYAMEM